MTHIRKDLIRVLAILFTAIFVTILLTSYALAARDREVYPSNVYVGGIYIGGLTCEEALQKLEQDGPGSWEKQICLSVPGKQTKIELSMQELGLVYDIPATMDEVESLVLDGAGPYPFNHALIRGKRQDIPLALRVESPEAMYRQLKEIKKTVDRPAVNARVLYKEGSLEYRNHEYGYVVDTEETIQRIKEHPILAGQNTIELAIHKISPHVRIEDVKNIKELIAVTAISIPPSDLTEMEKLLDGNNGTVLLPGDHVLLPGEETQSQEIKKLLIQALEPGARMAQIGIRRVNDTSIDMTNTLSNPILISMEIEDAKLFIRLFGCQTEKGKEILTIKEQKIVPYGEKLRPDNSLKNGQQKLIQAGQNGMVTRSYRVVKKNGREVERSLLSEQIVQPKDAVLLAAPDTVLK